MARTVPVLLSPSSYWFAYVKSFQYLDSKTRMPVIKQDLANTASEHSIVL